MKTQEELNELSYKFVDESSKIMGFGYQRDIIENKRKVFINPTKAYYNNISSVCIEWEGSPSRFPIYLYSGDGSFNSLGESNATSILMVCGKKMLWYSKKRNAIIELIKKFLQDCEISE